MSEIQRYYIKADKSAYEDGDDPLKVYLTETGKWVKYEDVEKLQARVRELQDEIRGLEPYRQLYFARNPQAGPLKPEEAQGE